MQLLKQNRAANLMGTGHLLDVAGQASQSQATEAMKCDYTKFEVNAYAYGHLMLLFHQWCHKGLRKRNK
jgi:hypothetical protein